MKKYIITILMTLLLFGGSSDLFAQRQQRRDGQGQQGTRPEQIQDNRPGMQQRQSLKDLKRLEQLRMRKLMDLLELDVNAENVVMPHIQNHHREMFQLMKKHQQKIDQLANGLRKNKLSDNEIIEKIDEIDQLEIDRQKKITEFHSKAKEILTAEQLGKLYVFQARFGGEVLDKMRNFRKAQEERRLHEDGN